MALTKSETLGVTALSARGERLKYRAQAHNPAPRPHNTLVRTPSQHTIGASPSPVPPVRRIVRDTAAVDPTEHRVSFRVVCLAAACVSCVSSNGIAHVVQPLADFVRDARNSHSVNVIACLSASASLLLSFYLCLSVSA